MKLHAVSNLQHEQIRLFGKYSVKEKCKSVRRQIPVERAIEQVTRWELTHRKGHSLLGQNPGRGMMVLEIKNVIPFRQKMFSLSAEVEDKGLSRHPIEEHV